MKIFDILLGALVCVFITTGTLHAGNCTITRVPKCSSCNSCRDLEGKVV